jgi:hypothetical protein
VRLVAAATVAYSAALALSPRLVAKPRGLMVAPPGQCRKIAGVAAGWALLEVLVDVVSNREV